ncbi:hypothetical protein ACIHBQ_26615 [Streptomyces sp. NPDC052492]|uniref:hypothetical protein n=1 Tax=unclassified Streptomyces TaxID=2593676 RepID=UPI0037D69229
MGYWGYFVVGRGERPLAGLDALAGAAGGLTLRTSAPDGWQVWEYPGREGEVGGMAGLARETGAPALFGYVMDSDCVAVEAASPESGVWTACLARDAMAGYLDGRQEGLTVDDYFLEPADAAERAVFWAEEAGRTVAVEDVLEVLTADPGPLAENLFFRLLDRLRVVPE